jgi:putative transposase
VKLREPLRFTGKIQSATVSREADRWFIAIAVEIPQREVHPPSGEALGIDLGLTTFAVLSNGQKVEAPKPLGKGLQRLRRLSRAHSRKRRGSHNRQKAALRLARCHRRIANMRRDFLHKFTTRISKNHAEIFVENLNVKGMVQNRHLSRAIHDVGWSELRRQLEYKSLLNGSVLTVRDPFYASSKTCSKCGYVMEVLPLSVREWTCPACQTTHDRDVNAAINLKQNTVGYTGINAWGQEGSGLAGTASETGLVEPGTLQWVNTHFHSTRKIAESLLPAATFWSCGEDSFWFGLRSAALRGGCPRRSMDRRNQRLREGTPWERGRLACLAVSEDSVPGRIFKCSGTPQNHSL